MIKRILAIFFTVTAVACMQAEAANLPHELSVYLFEKEPGTSIRFDGLINCPDGTVYLPIIPAESVKVEKAEIKYTYPAHKKFSARPDAVVFNNNYGLLKVIANGKKKTVTSYGNLPQEIVTGMLPQDLLVPNGLYLPDTLRGILGNVVVPVVATDIPKSVPKKSGGKALKLSAQKSVVKATGKGTYTVPKVLKDKMFLVSGNNSQYLKVFVPGQAEPLYGLKLKGLIKDVKAAADEKYVLVASCARKSLDIADLLNEQVAASVDLEAQPSETVVDTYDNKAYVLSTEDKSVFVINLEKADVAEKIKLDATPYKLTLSTDNSKLAFADKNTGLIYVMNLDGQYVNYPVTEFKNLSEMIVDGDKIYALSRTKNALTVAKFDLDKENISTREANDETTQRAKLLSNNMKRMLGAAEVLPVKEQEKNKVAPEIKKTAVSEKTFRTGDKPVRMLLYADKLYILCAGTNEVDVFNTKTLKYEARVKLPLTGFASRIVPVGNSEYALITDANGTKYALFNLPAAQTEGVYPIDVNVHEITVVDKINNIKVLDENL